MTEAQPKVIILQNFIVVLHNRNPMNISLESISEYENEALSILSRFTEAAIHLSNDEAIAAQLATAIVKQSLEFWFNEIGAYDAEKLARELLSVYRLAHGVPSEAKADNDQFVTEPTVESVTIGG